MKTVFAVKSGKIRFSSLIQDEIEIVVQIMGKVRDRFWVPVDISEEDLKARALELEKIKEQIQGKNIVKIIVVPQKLINIVAK